MKKYTMILTSIASIVIAQTGAPMHVGPVFDSVGHMTAYHYADGTRELYGYDSKWRMVSFTNRNRETTTFLYGLDSVTTILSNGTRRVRTFESATRGSR